MRKRQFNYPAGPHVYAFGGNDGPPYKIGYCSNLQSRVFGLRSGKRPNNPLKHGTGSFVRYWDVFSPENAMVVEEYVHAVFHKQRSELGRVLFKNGKDASFNFNEWFDASLDEIDRCVFVLFRKHNLFPPFRQWISSAEINEILTEMESISEMPSFEEVTVMIANSNPWRRRRAYQLSKAQ